MEQKYVYLFELDSVRKSDREILIGQQALYDEIVGNGNKVVLTFNQLVDSRGFFSLLDIESYYSNLVSMFKKGAICISRFGDVRTIAQYLINSLAYERSFIYSGWPLKSAQKRLLALIKRSLIYSDLTEIDDYCNGVRSDAEVLDLFIEVDEQRQEKQTDLDAGQCKAILENLFHLIKTVLRLSAMPSIYINPKPGDEYKMSLPKYLHHALSLSPPDNSTLWNAAKDILLSLEHVKTGVRARTEPVYEHKSMKGSMDRSDYHHALALLYHEAVQKNPQTDVATFRYAEAIVDLCYNYQLEYSICNSSKHYHLSEFSSAEPENWVTFSADFFSRLAQTWNLGDHNSRYLLEETNVFDEYERSTDFPDFSRAVHILSYAKQDAAQEKSDSVPRYEHQMDAQKETRRSNLLSAIWRRILFSLMCFALALGIEVAFEMLQNLLDAAVNEWINVHSMLWTLFCVAMEILVILGMTEWLSARIAKRFPDFMQLSDALSEIGLLLKEKRAIRKMYKSGCKTYANPAAENSGADEPRREGRRIFSIQTDAIKKYIRMQDSRRELFSPPGTYPIADLSSAAKREAVLRDLLRLEELYGYQFGVVYGSRYNTVMVDPIEVPQAEDATAKKYFPYERIVPSSGKDGVVMIPKCGDRYILLRQFRHAIRAEQYSFPRGYAENGGDSQETAILELQEELHAGKIKSIQPLGCRVATDSGLTSTRVHLYLAELEEYDPQIGYEGILEAVLLTEQEMDQWIREGKITDSFTLCAWVLLKAMQ